MSAKLELEEYLTVEEIAEYLKQDSRSISRHWPRWSQLYGVRIRRKNGLPKGSIMINKQDFLNMIEKQWGLARR